MASALKRLSIATGASCAAIGVFHLVGGTSSVPGERDAGPTVDSRERFYGAVFLGYGLGWLRAGSRNPPDRATIRWLSGVFLLGAGGRVLSRVRSGRPHWFQDALTVVELVLPPVFFGLTAGDEQEAARSPGL